MATYFDRVWDDHVIADLGDGSQLLHVDRHLLQDISSPQAFEALRKAGRSVRHPELTFAVPDHIVSTAVGRTDATTPGGSAVIQALRANAAANGIRMFDLGQAEQGISHMVSAEQGLSLPGLVQVSSDVHTCSAGALGTIAWAIGTTQTEHVLATQTVVAVKPKTMQVRFDGAIGFGVSAKDLILALIGRIGTRGGAGCAIEYSGAAVRAMDLAGRATLCNMSVEAGAVIGYVVPNDTVFDYLNGRPYAPRGDNWTAAMAAWRDLITSASELFDQQIAIDASEIAPQITWGTTPQHVIAITGRVPAPSNPAEQRALNYMGLSAQQSLDGLPIDAVFIGSCTNGRLEDLRIAAQVLRGRKIAPGVRALAVPGSGLVKRAAEAEGLDAIFRDSGFEWREPGCSMCAGLNPDNVAPGERCVSTANRNVEGRPGPGARIHLSSPAMAAAAAVTGTLTDVRRLMEPA